MDKGEREEREGRGERLTMASVIEVSQLHTEASCLP